MHRFVLAPCAFALALVVCPSAKAAGDADLAEIREQITATEGKLRSAHPGAGATAASRPKRKRRPRRRLPMPRRPRRRCRSGIVAPARVGHRRVQPGDLGGAAGRLRQPVAGSEPATRSPASRRAATSRPAKRGFSLAESELDVSGERRRQVRRQPHVLAVAREHGRGRGGVRSVHAAPYGLAPKFGRFLSGIGYHQRPAPARVGFRRRAARLPGVPRRPVPERRAAGEMGRADRALRRARRRGRQRRGLPGHRSRTRTASATATPTRMLGGDVGDEQQLARRAVVPADRAAGSRRGRRPISPATTRAQRSPGAASIAIADFVWKWAPNGNAQDTQLQAAGRVLLAARERRSDLRHATDALGFTQTGNYRSRSERLVPAGRLAVHADLARRRALRPARSGQRRLRQRTASTSPTPARFNPQRAAVMLDWTPDRVQPLPPAVRAAKLEAGCHRQPDLRAIHPDAGRARRAQVLKGTHHEIAFCVFCAVRSPARSRLPALAALNVFASRARVGRARAGARRRQGQGLRRDHRAAGPASRRGAPEPDRARAQRRPRRRHRRGARDRLAAARAAAGRQPRDPAGQAGLLRGGAVRDAAREARRASTAPRATCIPAAIRTSRPIRATSRKVATPLAARLAELDPPNAAYYQARDKAFRERWSAAIASWEKRGGAAEGRAGRRPAQGLHLSASPGSAATRSQRSSRSRASSRRPRTCRRCSRRCSASRRRW